VSGSGGEVGYVKRFLDGGKFLGKTQQNQNIRGEKTGSHQFSIGTRGYMKWQ
jgi:hypothetical protein